LCVLRNAKLRENTVATILTEELLDAAAQAHIDGLDTPEQRALLQADTSAWVAALWRLLDQAEARLEHARHNVRGSERANVLNDLDDECYLIDDAITALVGEPTPEELAPPKPPKPEPTGTPQLQLSWSPGQIVAWAGGHDAVLESHHQIVERLGNQGASAIAWTPGDTIDIPTAGPAETVTAPVAAALGWLAAQAREHNDDRLGASVRWMGLVTATAVEHVAQGRYVPQVGSKRGGGRGKESNTFTVEWTPALVDSAALEALVTSLPGTVMAGQNKQDRRAFTMSVLADIVHTIVAMSAGQVEVPAPPPNPRTRNDVGEAILGHLNGAEFTVPKGPASEISRKVKDWANPVRGTLTTRLIVQLDPPDESNGWFAQVLAPTERGGVEPIELAETGSSKSRSRVLKEQLARLERMFPELMRPGGRRRGEVVLSQDEAWRLMAEDGDLLRIAGYDLRVPKLARKKARPSLRLTSEEGQDTVVGAQQLANVRWSVVFDDVELTAADISRLAAEARPLVRSRGQWIEVDQVDLEAAAAALAERANKTQMTGADMLRHALGLEGNPFDGGINLAGDGWAAGLFKGIEDLPEFPEVQPDGFEGELRSYQADALSWLNFLDDAGLGGCLALDMGLGKTPTTLAAFAAATEHGPGLVVAPPAVVGNWANEAATFVPGVSVHVHHGPSRLKGATLQRRIENTDLIITTYGTAVRDMDELCKIEWGKVAIDEAQAIKNPQAETSMQLRRLNARTRVALTGTPIENGLGDLWAIMDWANPGLVGARAPFVAQLTPDSKSRSAGGAGEEALKALNGVLVYRRTKAEPDIAAELPDRIDELDHCAMTPEQIGLYQAVIDSLVVDTAATDDGSPERKGAVLAAITALKQICNHPVNYQADDDGLDGRSGKLARLNEIMESVFAADEKMLIFTHFASWGERLAEYLAERYDKPIECYHGGLARGARDRMVDNFQERPGAGALVLSLKAGGTGLNLTAANHVVLYDRWWNPAVEDQARDRVWRIGQTKTVIAHRLVCPGTVDERVEEVVAGKRQIANMVLPKSSSVADLDAGQLQAALGIDPESLLTKEDSEPAGASA
jgi:hypothetical protein